MKLLLASKSPRRRALAESFNLQVVPVDINVEEVPDPTLQACHVAEYLARMKSESFDTKQLRDDEVLLTADTVVVVDGQVIGKPRNREDAVTMLRTLSGTKHTVYTGVSLRSVAKQVSFTERTDVHFRPLTDHEINYYIDTCRPFDKAGAYGIQEWIGMVGIERIEGDYYNVVGLPVAHTYQVLTSEFSTPATDHNKH